ncbi:hypothetical protein CEXT_597741 [Caerostris extrusa]|uniref:Uncharacterized protein n=1 Tax=Caerostris extrusa TaxID=172846 RepID=A0AAV4YEK2_CAEEX|nr:hypothetical protein CEXT_597741 [Caerostris extrusa]
MEMMVSRWYADIGRTENQKFLAMRGDFIVITVALKKIVRPKQHQIGGYGSCQPTDAQWIGRQPGEPLLDRGILRRQVWKNSI